MSDNVESNQSSDDKERVQRKVTELLEHFDTVQIFVTRHMPAEMDGTVMCNRGGGSWNARYGQIREWLIYEEQRIRECARKNFAQDNE